MFQDVAAGAAAPGNNHGTGKPRMGIYQQRDHTNGSMRGRHSDNLSCITLIPRVLCHCKERKKRTTTYMVLLFSNKSSFWPFESMLARNSAASY